MAVLEELKPGSSIRGVLPNGIVTVGRSKKSLLDFGRGTGRQRGRIH